MPYREAWEYQASLQRALIDAKLRRRRGESVPADAAPPEHRLLFVEHPPVYTLGKSGDAGHLLRPEAELVHIDRGGDITFHGPGQIVGYPILDLDAFYHDLHRYLRELEEVVIRTVADYGHTAIRIPGLTGVWVNDRKVCAFGVKCSRWVTLHGFALNVNTDLGWFGHIVPCGIPDKGVTSLAELTGAPVSVPEVKARLLHHFTEVFGVVIHKESP